MDDKLKLILEDYIESVNYVCNRLLEGINSRENLNLKDKWDFFEYRSKQKKMEFEVNGISYRLHGRGCIAFDKEKFIDWDFGYRSRWCGIDPWFVAMTLVENKSNHIEFYDGKLIKEACEKAVLDGEMFEKYGQYYFEIPISQTFEPNFPKEFDTLIVEHFDSKWIMPRNKVIDRFIRKSKRVYNQIYNSENKHILKFFFDNKEVYSIPYDDICYPENAIKIMTDDILWNLKKQNITS